MVFKTTSTRPARRGIALPELMIATAITSLVLLVLASMFVFTSHSCASIANYFDLDRYSRIALDHVTQELRQARNIVSFDANQVTFVDGDGVTVQYVYDSKAQKLTRIAGTTNKILLVNCDWLKFEVFQRNPMNGTYDTYYAAKVPEDGKLVLVSWGCSREVLGAKLNTEVVQSSKIVIRKKQS